MAKEYMSVKNGGKRAYSEDRLFGLVPNGKNIILF
jgi:hypothetical protein